ITSKVRLLFSLWYVNAANALEQETKLSLRGFEVCDNIDLETILMDYESYYFVKFQKYPKITKKALDDTGMWLFSKKKAFVSQSLKCVFAWYTHRPSCVCQRLMFELSYITLEQSDFGLSSVAINKTGGDSTHPRRERLLKPLSAFIGMTGEMRELATVVSKDIYLHNPNMKWDDIIGLDAAKRLVKEAVVYPIRLFTGTGKTLLAKAVATECNTTFFNISVFTIVSKWRGDSEKLVWVLFELAWYHAPSIIFLDELVSVMSQRGTVSGGEHEGTASNLDLDSALLQRLEKRILVDLPSKEAWQVMIQHWLPSLSNSRGVELRTDLDYSLLGKETDGYSTSDVKLVCKEAAMRPVRKISDALENHQPGTTVTNLPAIRLDTITTADFLDVITHTKPSAKNLSQKYTAWQREFESV
uniref:Katanin p60 ATPase-containing subunit A-like 2 n=1 Tax=Strix occidentalis caurina TaxID=311401 RepID=A0A8D0FXP9_STROC